MQKRLNLLFVSQLYPWPVDRGTALRVYHLLAGFAKRHRVTFVVIGERHRVVDERFPLWSQCQRVIVVPRATCAASRTRRFDEHPPLPGRLWTLVSSPLPAFVQGWKSPELLKVLRDLRATEEFDTVWVERSFMAETVRAAGFKRIVVDVDDIESAAYLRTLRLRPWYLSKPLHYVELAKRYIYERLLPFRFWRLVVCKEEDRRFFGAQGANGKVFVVPNGVPALPVGNPAEEVPTDVLFVGHLGWGPNIDSVRYFAAEIFPQIKRAVPRARFLMVGVDPVPELRKLANGSDLLLFGSVPDVGPYFDRAAVVVVPMRLGGGTKIKVLESLARGKAVVSTSIGAEGLALRARQDLEIADDPDTFAAACVRLLQDPAARRRLAQTGRERVLSQYQWAAISRRADAVLSPEALLGPPPGRTGPEAA